MHSLRKCTPIGDYIYRKATYELPLSFQFEIIASNEEMAIFGSVDKNPTKPLSSFLYMVLVIKGKRDLTMQFEGNLLIPFIIANNYWKTGANGM